MSDENWYRNCDWTPEIEAAFTQRIGKARAQKAQYLMLQGQALISRHPDVAARLLRQSIALENEFHLNQANCYLGLAELASGNVDAALTAYEAALEAQLRFPFVQTGAPLDYAFAVAWFARSERYEAALQILEAVKPSVFPGADFQVHSAHALILADLGSENDARTKAHSALATFPDAVDASWGGVDTAELRERLRSIAALTA